MAFAYFYAIAIRLCMFCLLQSISINHVYFKQQGKIMLKYCKVTMLYKLFFCIVTVITLFSCKPPAKPGLFSLMNNTGIQFNNKLTETKDFNVFKYRNFYNGGGVATGDINNDGLPDIFFTANQGANKLYINKGNFSFEDISEKAGFANKKQWSTGVVFADINADGWLDIYVCNAGNMFDTTLRRNQLFINNHNLTFTESAHKYGLDNDGYSTQASFFDYDRDGDLDCFIVNNSPIPVNTLNHASNRDLKDSAWDVADFLKGGGDHLYRNDNGYFNEVSAQAGIHGSLISLGLGVTVSDVNSDGWPDVYVSNDFFERDYLYVNQKNGTFKDDFENLMQHTSLSSMGADIQDINNDGYPDVFTTDMLPADDKRLKANTSFEGYDQFKLKQTRGFYNQFTQNALQVNNGNGRFLETGFYSGVAASDWSWGALLFDADNDGLNDILVCNGIYRDVTDQDFIDFFANDIVQQMVIKGKKEEVSTVIDKMPSNPIPNKMFRNTGNLKFEDVGDDWGLGTPSFSNGAAYADFDNDGDLDVVINNVNQDAFVYKNNNEQLKNNFIAVSLQYKAPNKFAIGTCIKIYQGNQIITREVIPSRGFQSCVDYKQLIGLGKASVDSITITWPDGTGTSLIKPAINTTVNITYEAGKNKALVVAAALQPLYDSLPVNFDKHIEDEFVDFYFERNVPFMLSRQGPKCAVADVNKDGLEDIFIGGAKNQPSQLYLQTNNGFVKKATPDFVTFSFNDITTALFFDCDGDKDLDLFAGGGGNFNAVQLGGYANQLYINDGAGNFTLKRGALPVSSTNCGAAVVVDYDSDGNNDLFIGSRSMPQSYGETPHNFLLHNDGKGQFEDVTAAVATAMDTLGMITAVSVADINNDKINDVIITGEWMGVQAFTYDGKKFVPIITGMEAMYGWWQSINVTDIDNDGDADMLLGNMGNNFYLQPNTNNPVKIWMKDFDQNNTIDKIFSRTIDGKDIPVFTKREVTDQLPSLKKMNLKHQDYANKTVQQLFDDGMKTTNVKTVNFTASIIAINDGKGKFTIKDLPYQAQLSSVNAIVTKDINGDGLKDIITAGNCINLLPQFCRVDASYGNVLINKGGGNFVMLPDRQTGFDVKGEVRDIAMLQYKKTDCIVFLQNNNFPVMYRLNAKVATTIK
jgi:enediyne biosynthesis protein E4